MNNFSHFQGKVCTILTSPCNRNFHDETQYTNTFVGIFEKSDDYGIWLIQLTTKRKTFFTYHSLVGIIEETVKFFDDEEAIQVKKQLESRQEEKLISIDSIKKLKADNQRKQ